MSERRLSRWGWLGIALLPVELAALGSIDSSAVMVALTYAGLTVLIIACFGSWLRRDPVGGASIVLPAVLVAAAGLTQLAEPAWTFLAFTWLLGWMSPLARHAWPWWERSVLRRFRPGSPEGEMRDALGRVWDSARPPRTEEGWIDGWRMIGEAWAWARPHTLPLHSVGQSWLRVVNNGTERAGERVWTRWDQELARLNRWVRRPWERHRLEADRLARPTRGTSLDYEYPRLESLLAAATEPEQRAMRAGAARIALAGVDLLTPERAAALRLAADGPVGPELQAEAKNALEALEDAPAGDRALQLHVSRIRSALRAFSFAIEELTWPLDATDAIYEAAKSQVDSWDVTELESMMIGIIGPDRAARAEEVPAVWVDKGGAVVSQGSTIETLRRTPGDLGWLVASAYLAGTIAHLFGHGLHVLVGEWDAAFYVGVSGALMLLLLVGIRLRGTRVDDADVWPAFAMSVGTLLIGRVFVPRAIDSIGGDPPEIVYALLYGLACLAAALAVYVFVTVVPATRRSYPSETTAAAASS